MVAAGVGVAARELSSQDVGLSAEPITVGDELAPATTEPERTETTERTETEEAPAAPRRDNSGKGRGRGRSGSGNLGSGGGGGGD